MEHTTKTQSVFHVRTEGPAAPFADICNVGAVPGGEAFLLDTGRTALLVDTGFGFCGQAMTERLAQRLGGRPLDYVLLTHSHYDHALGAPWCTACWPETKVIASTYTQYVFTRESARRAMRELDASAAAMFGAAPASPDRVDELRVDLALEDGQTVELGGLSMQAVALPGHTRCSMGFYFPKEKLLLACETLGVTAVGDLVIPAFLVGYAMTLASFERAASLEVERILVPHRGLIEGAECAQYLRLGRMWTERCCAIIVDGHRAGKTEDAIMEDLRAVFYTGVVQNIQPEEAFVRNARAMIPMVIREVCG